MRLRYIALYLAYFAGRKAVECTPFVRQQSPRSLAIRGGGGPVSDEGISAVADTEVSPDQTAEINLFETNASKLPDIDSLIFAVSKSGDGSETDPDGIPDRFLRMQKGNRDKAKAAFEHTVKWRDDHEVDTILKRPQPKFDLCKKIFPVYIPGRDRQNHVVVVQRVGLIDIEYGEKNDVSGDDLLWYYIYMIEYCWNILEPAPDAVMTTIMDLKGLRMKTFRDGNIRKFLRKFVAAMSDNYPNRSHKTMVINAPAWINAAYNLVKPLMRSSTREKISISNGGEKQDSLLIEILGADHVPRELLNDPSSIPSNEDDNSKSETGHVLSEIEKEMRELVSYCNFTYPSLIHKPFFN